MGFLAFSRWSWEKYVSEKPRPGYLPLDLSYSAQGTYKGEQFLDAEQITKNKIYIYTREKNTGFDRRFLMKRVGGGWMMPVCSRRPPSPSSPTSRSTIPPLPMRAC